MEFFGLTFVMFIGAAVVLLGILILMFSAFATSMAWGLASLLIPPLAIGFALTHWSKGKNGFAIVMIGLAILAYGSWDNERVKKYQSIERAEEALRTEPVIPLSEPEVDSVKGLIPKAPPRATPPVRSSILSPATTENAPTKVVPTIINIIDAHKFVDSEIRVTTTNGAVRIGVLREVNKVGIVLEYKPKGVDTLIKTEIQENRVQLMELVH